MPGWRPRLTLVLAAAAVVGAGVGVVAVTRPGPSRPVPTPWSGAAPRVWPTPREVSQRVDGFRLGARVGVVHDAGTDPAALDAVVARLRQAGVADVRVAAADPGTPVTVWLSGTADRLARLGVRGAAGLPAEGYVLAAGRAGDRDDIVLDGAGPAGQFYAAQTLRQLIVGRGDATIAGIAIRDWPAMARRGTIEGFYGPPWSADERLDMIDYLAAHKMNAYEYSPKDDPYLRERWREPYPPERLRELGTAIARAAREHVEYTFAVSPGLSICYTAPADVAALLAKFDAVYALGARSFNVPLDDIDPKAWHCAGDRARYGNGPAAAGVAQAELVNAVVDWARAKGDVRAVQTVPTEYFDAGDSPYKRALRERLAPAAVVLWTGVGVIPATITPEQAATAGHVFGHPILIWDNYPVNDYIPGRLPLGPYAGRGPGLAGPLLGIVANPAIQPAPSKVSLFAAADLDWHDNAYRADEAWAGALAELAGGDPVVAFALAVVADLSTFDGMLHTVQAPRLRAAIDTFWADWHTGDQTRALAALRPHLDAIAEAPARVIGGVTDPGFVAQARPWLDATADWGTALRAPADGLAALLAGDPAGVSSARERVAAAVAAAGGRRDARTGHTALIGDGVVDRFVDDALAELDRGGPPG